MEQCLFPKGVLSISCYWFCLLYRSGFFSPLNSRGRHSALLFRVTFGRDCHFLSRGCFWSWLLPLFPNASAFHCMFLLCPTTLSSPVCSHCSSHLFLPPKFLRVKVTLNCPFYLFTQFTVLCLKYGPSSRIPKSFKCRIWCYVFPSYLPGSVCYIVDLPSILNVGISSDSLLLFLTSILTSHTSSPPEDSMDS